MRKTALTLTVATLVLGVFGAFFRWLQTINAFEAETGYPIPGHGTSVVFVLYCVLALAAVCVAAVVCFRGFACEKTAAALGSASSISSVLGWCFGAVFVLASLVILFTAHHTAHPVFRRLLGAFGILAGLSLPFLVGKRDAEAFSVGKSASAVAALFFCLWLVYSYQSHSENPIIWSFATEILALAASATAFYYIAAFHFGAGHGRRALISAQLAVFFDIVTLVDDHPAAETVLLAVSAAMLLMTEYLLLTNLQEHRES